MTDTKKGMIECLPCVSVCRDRGDHFKVVGLKTLANIKKNSGRCFAIYLAIARHLIYHLKKYNKNVTSTRVILSNIANMLHKPPEVVTF